MQANGQIAGFITVKMNRPKASRDRINIEDTSVAGGSPNTPSNNIIPVASLPTDKCGVKLNLTYVESSDRDIAVNEQPQHFEIKDSLKPDDGDKCKQLSGGEYTDDNTKDRLSPQGVGRTSGVSVNQASRTPSMSCASNVTSTSAAPLSVEINDNDALATPESQTDEGSAVCGDNSDVLYDEEYVFKVFEFDEYLSY